MSDGISYGLIIGMDLEELGEEKIIQTEKNAFSPKTGEPVTVIGWERVLCFTKSFADYKPGDQVKQEDLFEVFETYKEKNPLFVHTESCVGFWALTGKEIYSVLGDGHYQVGLNISRAQIKFKEVFGEDGKLLLYSHYSY